SNLDGRWNHPVVQISWDDAAAYATWAGKRLPTEAEWEFAARGGLEQKRYAWGDEFMPDGKRMANIWQGHFPDRNTNEDGFAGTAPVKSFPANGYGLYDMIGNVWEWCSDWFDARAYRQAASGVCENPAGPARSFNPENPEASQRVIRGGSFMCAENYCRNYRPSARRGTDWDTGLSNLGFRCVK
ncbi:MAG: SUMF1/EgtB/PvdO family nonheme iron enzyme, partial [Phycisphaerae bacterium]